MQELQPGFNTAKTYENGLKGWPCLLSQYDLEGVAKYLVVTKLIENQNKFLKSV